MHSLGRQVSSKGDVQVPWHGVRVNVEHLCGKAQQVG